MSDAKAIFLGEIKVNSVDLEQATASLDSLLRDGGRHYVSFCEANTLVQACRNPEVAAALNRSSLTLPDGILLVVMARLLGRPLAQRLPGPSFMLAVCERGVAKGYRHFFLGGQEGVAQELADRLRARFPGLIVAGTYSAPFRPPTAEDEEEIRRVIEVARPDLLWVGLGGSKQVLWMAGHQGTLNVPVMLGVGAAFDFHAGRVPWGAVLDPGDRHGMGISDIDRWPAHLYSQHCLRSAIRIGIADAAGSVADQATEGDSFPGS